MKKVIPAISKKLTKTMIEKGNPDCFKELASLARLFGVEFDTLENGEKQELPLVFADGTKRGRLAKDRGAPSIKP